MRIPAARPRAARPARLKRPGAAAAEAAALRTYPGARDAPRIPAECRGGWSRRATDARGAAGCPEDRGRAPAAAEAAALRTHAEDRMAADRRPAHAGGMPVCRGTGRIW